MPMIHRADKNRMVFASASAVIWGTAAAWAGSVALQLPILASLALALGVGGGTFYILNRRPDNRRL